MQHRRECGSEELARIVDELARAYAAEKTAGTNTNVVLELARARGVQFKALALGVIEKLSTAGDPNIVEKARLLEDAFRQRLTRHRRRASVIRDHNAKRDVGVHNKQTRPRNNKETAMTDRYGRPRFVRELYYGDLPPDLAPPDVEDLNGDHDLDGTDERPLAGEDLDGCEPRR